MGRDHSHAVRVGGNEKPLLWALGLTAAFMGVEIAGGILANSLALLSDAAHMFTDVTALAISLAAVRIGKRTADDRRSYGYQRFEILAAAFNALLLFAVAGYILYEAYRRFRSPPEVQSTAMLWIAIAGLAINFIAMKLLSAGREGSLNIKGAYLEVWSDMLGSAGVIAAALIIRFTGWGWVDPLVAVGIGLWVLPRTWLLLKASMNILLEGTPADVDVGKLRSAIQGRPGVIEVHDLHVWSLTTGRHVLTAHVVSDGPRPQELLREISALVRDEHGISHTTIQLEERRCGDLHAPLHESESRSNDPGHGARDGGMSTPGPGTAAG